MPEFYLMYEKLRTRKVTWLAKVIQTTNSCCILFYEDEGCPPNSEPETHLPGMRGGVTCFILLSWAFDLEPFLAVV